MKIVKFFLLCFGIVMAPSASAQSYPQKPIRLILGVGPGSGVETTARPVTAKMEESLGQPIVIEFRPGASGVIGAEAVARALPDGYTLFYTIPDPIVRRPASAPVPYDPVADFTPITMMIKSFAVLVANPAFAVKDIRELIEHARRNPGTVNYGTNGTGTGHHLLGDQLARMARINLIHVPYKSGAPSLLAGITGEIQVVVSAAGSATPFIKSGKLKLLGVLDEERSRALPDVPAVTETLPGFLGMPSWLGFFGPAKMSRPIVDRLHLAITQAANAPDVRARFDLVGQQVIGNTPEQFAVAIKKELGDYKALLTASGIKPE
ncbi:MAG: Bug family tripartite tricarboxylate transporter substrate binding protein [Burkholderiales bacterium]